MRKQLWKWFIFILLPFLITVNPESINGAPVRNILLLNSYHQGYAWTDSLTLGINDVFGEYPDINLFIENLNSKKFGQTAFEIEKDYLREKYAKIPFDGMIVTDNDALDFSFRYGNELFPHIPVVFAGISNPEEYPLENSHYYGFKETGTSDNVVEFVKTVLPESKRLLIIADLTTTGIIYRREFMRQAAAFKDFMVIFPDVIDLDSIYKMVETGKNFDAVYCVGINMDNKGRLVDIDRVLSEICSRSVVPVFSNTPVSVGSGILGGLFQSGTLQGRKSADLLLKLLDTNHRDSVAHINQLNNEYFFDASKFHKFNISKKNLPEKSIIFNEDHEFYREKFNLIIYVLVFLLLSVTVLSVKNRQRRIKQRKSNEQLRKIEQQKDQLEEAYKSLSGVISELENTNQQLYETNADLDAARKKAEESDNLKSAFLANVSHEIRTPLNSIVGFSSLLSDQDLDESTRKTYINLIESNTESLLVLIDEIIDLSKIEAGQLSLKIQDFSMDHLMSEQCQIFSKNNKNPDVVFNVVIPNGGKSLQVNSDRVRVKQIFINLLSNALKFTNSGTIELGYRIAENQEIVFYVKDTGIGISNEFHQAIFHRFRKLNENSGKVFRGTGLGLAITQKLVGLLGGKIWLESEPGQGTTFYFTLQDCELKDA